RQRPPPRRRRPRALRRSVRRASAARGRAARDRADPAEHAARARADLRGRAAAQDRDRGRRIRDQRRAVEGEPGGVRRRRVHPAGGPLHPRLPSAPAHGPGRAAAAAGTAGEGGLSAMSEVLTTKQLAEYLKLSERSVYRLLERGEIPAVKVGGQWRFRKSAVDEWLDLRFGSIEPADLEADADDGAGA